MVDEDGELYSISGDSMVVPCDEFDSHESYFSMVGFAGGGGGGGGGDRLSCIDDEMVDAGSRDGMGRLANSGSARSADSAARGGVCGGGGSWIVAADRGML